MQNSSEEASYKMVTWKNCEGDVYITLRLVVGVESRQHKLWVNGGETLGSTASERMTWFILNNVSLLLHPIILYTCI